MWTVCRLRCLKLLTSPACSVEHHTQKTETSTAAVVEAGLRALVLKTVCERVTTIRTLRLGLRQPKYRLSLRHCSLHRLAPSMLSSMFIVVMVTLVPAAAWELWCTSLQTAVIWANTYPIQCHWISATESDSKNVQFIGTCDLHTARNEADSGHIWVKEQIMEQLNVIPFWELCF